MNQNVRSIESFSKEINVWELMEYLKNGWRWLLGGAGFGLLGAFCFLISTSPQYEASSIIQPATTGITKGTVEPITQTLERLKFAGFYDGDIVKACQANSAEELMSNVRAGLMKGNSLFSISYRADSAKLAKTCLARVIEQLTQSQATIAAPLIKELEEQRASTKQQIDDRERFLAQNEKRVATSVVSNESVLLILKREELMQLQKLYREQRTQLTAPFTQPMRLLEPIYVQEKRAYPRTLIATVIGVVGGLFVGLLVLFVSRGWHRFKSLSTN